MAADTPPTLRVISARARRSARRIPPRTVERAEKHRRCFLNALRLVLLAAGALLAAVPRPALAQSGGAAAPDSGGGHAFEQPSTKPPAGKAPRLRATIFTVTPGSVELGRALRFTWRVDGPVRAVTARVTLTPDGGGKAIAVALGRRRAGSRAVRTWTAKPGRIAAGRYIAKLHASGPRGAKLRRTARAAGRLTLLVTAPAPPPPPPPPPAPAPVERQLPRAGRLQLRRGRRALRRRPHRPRPPGPGHHRRRRHAGRHAGRRDRALARLPGQRRRLLRRDPRRRRARLRLHALPGRLDAWSRRAGGSPRGSAWPTSATRATPRARTCTSRSGPTAGTPRPTRTRSTRCRSCSSGPASA